MLCCALRQLHVITGRREVDSFALQYNLNNTGADPEFFNLVGVVSWNLGVEESMGHVPKLSINQSFLLAHK